jgi:hypothetical protein
LFLNWIFVSIGVIAEELPLCAGGGKHVRTFAGKKKKFKGY